MEIKYEESIFYQIKSTAKYFDMLFEQFFKELNVGITGVEHLALCIIIQTKDCCQRDLAKIILKDRANTGKLANKLQEKGLINIETKTKNNKLVKILTITKKGEKLCKNIHNKIKPLSDKVKKDITTEKTKLMIENLKEFRQIVKKAVKTNI